MERAIRRLLTNPDTDTTSFPLNSSRQRLLGDRLKGKNIPLLHFFTTEIWQRRRRLMAQPRGRRCRGHPTGARGRMLEQGKSKPSWTGFSPVQVVLFLLRASSNALSLSASFLGGILFWGCFLFPVAVVPQNFSSSHQAREDGTRHPYRRWELQ